MVCEKFKQMDDFDRVMFQAKLLHVVQSDDRMLDAAQDMIQLGILKGYFDNVKFGHEIAKTQLDENWGVGL